jgi:hypothetical protein
MTTGQGEDYRRGLMKIAADLAGRGPVPHEVPTGQPPKIRPSPEAIAAGMQFEFISGRVDRKPP